VQRVLVVDKNKQPLMPCHPARARKLLKQGRAAVFRREPFTIILKDRDSGETQDIQIKFDPGSKTTGIALIADFKHGKRVVWASELHHRSQQIRDALLSRRQLRRSRRNRKTRYRKPRFLNRCRPAGWLPPSLQSRVDNVMTWAGRLWRFAPITGVALELVKFDTQAMQNPEISGVEYQQGTLQGYEVREYLLEKWNRTCAYCGATNVPLEIEHIVPKSRGGSNRVSNLTLACHDCNQRKGIQTAAEFGYPKLQAKAKHPLKDAAAVNVTRWALYDHFKASGIPLEVGTGARTRYNRTRQCYPKAHWIDAACVGESGEQVYITPGHIPLVIKATGRQSRVMCRPDKYGFPRTTAKSGRVQYGFQTGDMVKAVVPKGKKAGIYVGRVAVRSSGSFNIATREGMVQGISYRCCTHLHKSDGYSYEKGEAASTNRRFDARFSGWFPPHNFDEETAGAAHVVVVDVACRAGTGGRRPDRRRSGNRY
jgi:5-methylcytosine-specific restriction endonuclease McrA